MDCLTEQFIEDLINIYELPVPVTDFDNFIIFSEKTLTSISQR